MPSRRSRALEHISEAEAFSREIGGLDKDVKNYLFNLSKSELGKVLEAYGNAHGRDARNYAADTIPKWRSGSVKMSGMVAKRLFDFLPRFMPNAKKYELTQSLWEHMGPSSKKMIRVGAGAQLDEVIARIREHITEVVTNFQIPEQMERRFTWLADGDVKIKQQLLNHLREQEKRLVIEGARIQVDMLMQKIRSDSGNHITRLTHMFRVGKHELHVVFQKDHIGVVLEDYRPILHTSGQGRAQSGSQIGIWIVVGLVILLIIALSG